MHTTDPEQPANAADQWDLSAPEVTEPGERDLSTPEATEPDERAEPLVEDLIATPTSEWEASTAPLPGAAREPSEPSEPSWVDAPTPPSLPVLVPEPEVETWRAPPPFDPPHEPLGAASEPVVRSGAAPRVVLVAVGVLVLLALVGLGAIKLRGALPPPPAPTRVVSHPTATVPGTATPVPTLPNFVVPNGQIGFGYGGAVNSTQTCSGTTALPALSLNVGNSGSVAVDWWVQVTQTLPDGKTLWTGSAPPYGTLPVGQNSQLQLQPDAGLCGELIGHSGTVQYTATVFYGGGDGAFTVTDTITPPPPGTSTPTPTVPPTAP